MNRSHTPRRMYGTDAVARILSIEQWRVKNFGLKPYELAPEKLGEGRGSRRRYSFQRLLQIDVANALSCKGQLFTSEAIPAAVRLITEDLINQWADSYDSEGKAAPLLLAFDGAVWKVLDKKSYVTAFNESLKDGTISVSLNLASFWESTVKRIGELEASGEI